MVMQNYVTLPKDEKSSFNTYFGCQPSYSSYIWGLEFLRVSNLEQNILRVNYLSLGLGLEQER